MKYEILGMPGERQLGLDTYSTAADALQDAIRFVGLGPGGTLAVTKAAVFGYDGRCQWSVERMQSYAIGGVDQYTVLVRKPIDT